MTKTQTKLLAAAKLHGGCYSVETCRGRGPAGGRISYGTRERDALFALEAAGAVEITSRQSSQEMMGNGNMVGGTVFAFRLIDGGTP